MTLGVVVLTREDGGCERVSIFNDTLISIEQPSTNSPLSTNKDRKPPSDGTRTATSLMQKTIVVNSRMAITVAGDVAAIQALVRALLGHFADATVFVRRTELLRVIENTLKAECACCEMEIIVCQPKSDGQFDVFQWPRPRCIRFGRDRYYIIGSGSTELVGYLKECGYNEMSARPLSNDSSLPIKLGQNPALHFGGGRDTPPFSRDGTYVANAFGFMAAACALDSEKGALMQNGCNGVFEVCLFGDIGFYKPSSWRIVLWHDGEVGGTNDFTIISASYAEGRLFVTHSEVRVYEDANKTERTWRILPPTSFDGRTPFYPNRDYFWHSPAEVCFAKTTRSGDRSKILPGSLFLLHGEDFLVEEDRSLKVNIIYQYIMREHPLSKGWRHGTATKVPEDELAEAERYVRCLFHDQPIELELGHNPPIDPLVKSILSQIPRKRQAQEDVIIRTSTGLVIHCNSHLDQIIEHVRRNDTVSRAAAKDFGWDLYKAAGMDGLGDFYRQLKHEFGVDALMLQYIWDGVGEWKA